MFSIGPVGGKVPIVMGTSSGFLGVLNNTCLLYTSIDLTDRKIVVAEGDKLSLGKHELTFVMAPMVHWPEVMMEYELSLIHI